MVRWQSILAGFMGFVCFSGLSFSAETILLSDTRGQDVEVSWVELARAYFTSFEPHGENHRIINGDGSVAILNPVFEYAGKKIPFRTHHSSGRDGICKYLGFNKAHGSEKKSITGPFIAANMSSNGTLYEIYQEAGTSTSSIIDVIVCSNRE